MPPVPTPTDSSASPPTDDEPSVRAYAERLLALEHSAGPPRRTSPREGGIGVVAIVGGGGGVGGGAGVGTEGESARRDMMLESHARESVRRRTRERAHELLGGEPSDGAEPTRRRMSPCGEGGEGGGGDGSRSASSVRRRRACAALCAASILASAVGTAVLLTRERGGGRVPSYPFVGRSSGDDGSVVPDAPRDIESVCSFESIRTVGGYVDCEVACLPGSCCMVRPHSNVRSCPDGYGDACGRYEVCRNLDFVLDDADEESVDHLSEEEEEDEFDDDDEDDDNDDDDDDEDEDEYDEDEDEYDEESDSSDIPADDEDADAIGIVVFDEGGMGPTLRDIVDERCAPDALATDAGLDRCSYACSFARCCFADDRDASATWAAGAGAGAVDSDSDADSVVSPGGEDYCSDAREGEWCGQYDACRHLSDALGRGTEEGAADDRSMTFVEAACSGSDSDSDSYCSSVCSAGACCFSDDPEGCDVDCSVYEPCSRLHREPPPPPPAAASPYGEEERGDDEEDTTLRGWAPSVCAPDLATASYRCGNPDLPPCDRAIEPTNRPCHVRCDDITGFGEEACMERGERCIRFVRGCKCPLPPCDEPRGERG